MNKNLVNRFVVVKALESSMNGWFFPIYALFVLSKGLSLFELNLLNTVFMTVSSVLNPITGVLGDRIGQKKVYLIGILFWAGGTFVYGLGETFLAFAFAEFCSAVGQAFMSEALESLIRNIKGNKEAQKALSSSGFWSNIVGIPSVVLGGIIGSVYGLNIPWLVSGSFSLLTFFISAILLKDFHEEVRGGGDKVTLRKTFKSVWKINSFRFALFANFVSALCFQPFNMFWGPIFKDLGGEVWWFGFLWIGVATAGGIGSKLLGEKSGSGKTLGFVFLTIAIPMLFASLSSNLWVVLTGFLLHEIGRGGINPIIFSLANRDNPNNDSRTTANSIKTSVRTFGAAAGLLIFGALTEFVSPLQTWTISAIFVIVLAVVCFRRRE